MVERGFKLQMQQPIFVFHAKTLDNKFVLQARKWKTVLTLVAAVLSE